MKIIKKEEIFNLAATQGLLPPFHHTDEKSARNVLDAIYEGGLRIIEYTNRSEHALKIFSSLVKHARKNLPDLVLGVGTIMNVKQAKLFYKEGAQFIVSPILEKSVGEFCEKHDLFWGPGAYSPTEIIQAHEWGASLVKIFPADTLSPTFVKALMGPCPWVKVMPSGGVTLEEGNIKQWLKSGVVCIAIGSQLFSKEIMQDGNYGLLTSRIEWLLTTISKIRDSHSIVA